MLTEERHRKIIEWLERDGLVKDSMVGLFRINNTSRLTRIRKFANAGARSRRCQTSTAS